MRRTGGRGPPIMTSTMRHVSALHNPSRTGCHRATALCYGNAWFGTNTMSYLGPAR